MWEYVLFVIGIVLLIKGAHFLIDGSSSLARKFKVPTLVIGLTIVALGTSMPELVVNIVSAIKGTGDIAFGNVIGSNIVNLLFILGLTAALCSIKVKSSTVWKEIPFSLLAALVILIFASTLFLDKLSINYLLRFEGIILLLFFGIFFYYIIELAKKNKNQVQNDDLKIKNLSSWKIFFYIAGGVVALYFGGRWTVDGAISLAKLFGMSEYFISLTIVSIGTSLPELITSIIAARRKDVDLAVGNVVGSNILNIFLVLGVTSLIAPIAIPGSAIIDLFVLLGATLLLFFFMFIGKKHELDRWQGIIFVLIYLAYVVYLILRG